MRFSNSFGVVWGGPGMSSWAVIVRHGHIELFLNPATTVINRGEKYFFRCTGSGERIFSGLVPKHC